MSKRRSFFIIIFSLIFSLLVTNCDVISFNGDIETQIMKDTTFTVIFHEYDPGDTSHSDSKVLVKHYELTDVIYPVSFPDRESKELKDWNPLYLIRGWKMAASSPNAYISIDGSGYVSGIAVKSILEDLDYGTYTIDLYPDWYRARIITFRDGNIGCTEPEGKDYSGGPDTFLRTNSDEKAYIPDPPYINFSISENGVSFEGWYTDPDCNASSKLPSDANGYYYQSTDPDDIYLYARWQYNYVYVDPQNTSEKADDTQTGIDSSHPVRTIAEAKKYLSLNDQARAIRLMSTIENENDINQLNSLTTSAYNYSMLLRSSGFTGVMIDISSTTASGGVNAELTIENLTIHGGAIWSSSNVSSRTNSGIKAGAPVIQSTVKKLTLNNVQIQNNDNIMNNYTNVRVSGVYSSLNLVCANCTFMDNSSYIASDENYKYCSVLSTDRDITLTDTTIKKNKGHGVLIGSNASSDSLINTTVTGNSEYGAYVSNGKTLTVDGSTYFDTPVYLEAYSAPTSANIKIQDAGNLLAPLVAKIKSDVYADSPKVLIDSNNGNYVYAGINKFTCTQEGYVIVYDSTNKAGYIKMQSYGIGLGVEIPDDYTEIDPGDFPSLNVYRSDGYIRFIVSSDAYNAINLWGTDRYIQYWFTSYGEAKIQSDVSVGYYADIPIPSDCSLGPNNIQVYAQAADSMTIITKKNYQIIVQ